MTQIERELSEGPMNATRKTLNPLRALRARIGLIVLAVIAALALFIVQYLNDRLTRR